MAENIFQNAAYRATVYRTGSITVLIFNPEDVLDPYFSFWFKGVLPDPVNCKCFYICNQVHEAVHECCNREELFDPKILNCNWAYAVDCGDRPLPGETTTRKTTPTTVINFLW